MFDSLFRKHLQPSLASQTQSTPDAVSRLTPKELLAAHYSLLNEIEELAGVPREFYRRNYETVLHNYANFVQQLPASENHHHATLGGILQHGLEVSVIALKLRRAYLLPPGATPEVIIQKQDLWTYAIFSAALCHDLSKPSVDQTVALFDAEGKESQWVPWTGPMPESIKWYRTKFMSDRVPRLHERASLLLVGHILPKEGIAWLSDDLSAFSQWVACIGGDTDQAGPIGEIVSRADRESVARNLGAEPGNLAKNSGIKPLHEKLLTGLRHLLTDGELPLNRNGAAGWLVGKDLWLVSKRAVDTLRANLLAEGHLGIPNRNDRIFDELQQRAILIPCNNRAIWRAKVKGEDWEHDLTLIRLPADNIWTDSEAWPEPFSGEVIPVEPAGTTLGSERNHLDGEMDHSGTDEISSPVGNDDHGLWELLPDGSIDGNVESVESNSDVESESRPTAQRTTTKPAAPDNTGQQFLDWLRENIRDGIFPIDVPNSRIYNVPEGVFLVSPAIFKEFIEQTEAGSNWEQVQKRFLKLHIHLKTPDGLNVHKRTMNGVTLHGILVSELANIKCEHFPERSYQIAEI